MTAEFMFFPNLLSMLIRDASYTVYISLPAVSNGYGPLLTKKTPRKSHEFKISQREMFKTSVFREGQSVRINK